LRNIHERIEVDPKFVEAYNNRGLAKASLRDFHGAIDDYTLAIAIDSTFEESYNNRGLAKLVNRTTWEQLLIFSKAIELNPDFTKALVNLGAVKGRTQRLPWIDR